MAYRGTTLNGRGHLNGGKFSEEHNRREFSAGDNIDSRLTSGNLYWTIGEKPYLDKDKEYHPSFLDAKMRFYKENFAHQYNEQMERYKAKGNHKRIKTFEEWADMQRYRPEQRILQIGNIKGSPTANELANVYQIYMKKQNEWNKTHGNIITTINWAIHIDESTPHIHEESVFSYIENGKRMIGQEKALKQAGVPLPDSNKPEGRRNNRKVEFDRMRREWWLDACEQAGITVERTPLEHRTHVEKKEYIREQARKMEEEKENLSKREIELEQKTEEIINLLQADPRGARAVAMAEFIENSGLMNAFLQFENSNGQELQFTRSKDRQLSK